MHIMEGECEKSGSCLTAEGAPELGTATKANGLVLAEEALENGDTAPSPESKERAISEEPPGEEEPGGSEEPAGSEEPDGGTEDTEAPGEEQPDVAEEPAGSEDADADGTPEDVPTPKSTSPEPVLSTKEEAEPSPPVLPSVPRIPASPVVSPVPSPPRENGLPSPPAASPKPILPPKEEKEDSEEEDKPSLTDKFPAPEVQLEKVRKRSLDGEASSSSESDCTKKRLRHQEPNTPAHHPAESMMHGEDERESSIQRFIEGCAQSIEEIGLASEKLQKEMSALAELAKAKEIEWNSILRLRKLKEETYERLQRKKREVQVLEGKLSDEFYHHIPYSNQASLAAMMPMVSSPMLARIPDLSKQQQRPILPKPFHQSLDHVTHLREGRNGPILDVKSIIADYSGGRRSRHGGDAPPGRRGRRRTMVPVVDHHAGPPPPPRHVSSSPSLISMANMALGTAFNVRTYDPPPPPYPPPPIGQERVGGGDHMANMSGMSFKEALVQFAKLGPGGGGGGRAGNVAYPEVTLHPVGSSGMGQPLHPSSTGVGGNHPPGGGGAQSSLHPSQTLHPPTGGQSQHPGGQSLLHGILTKGPVPAHTKPPPTTFSPTLARLLTAPDHPRPQPAHQNSYHRPSPVSINEILASKKSRTDITITPVSSSNAPSKPKEEVVLLQDEDEEGSTGDRLVIDEGPDSSNQEDVPQCQGCRQKPAQFVCAGCGNQWYCSRECQVSAWEEHSDVCSG